MRYITTCFRNSDRTQIYLCLKRAMVRCFIRCCNFSICFCAIQGFICPVRCLMVTRTALCLRSVRHYVCDPYGNRLNYVVAAVEPKHIFLYCALIRDVPYGTMFVTRTGIDYQKGVIPVQPGMSDTPLGCRIEMGSIPVGNKKRHTPKGVCLFLVTRTGIEPMLPP